MRLLCSLLGLCLLLGCQPQATKPAPRPNILFIFTDDHALQAIGAYGSVLNKTPRWAGSMKEAPRRAPSTFGRTLSCPSTSF